VLTESDLFTNLDTSLLFPQNLSLELEGKRPGAMEFGGSQLLPDSSFRRSMSQEPARLEDPSLIDLDLDLGEDELPLGMDHSVEIGRDAPPSRPMDEDLFSDSGKLHDDSDLPLDIGDAPLEKLDFGSDNMNDPIMDDGPMDFGDDAGFGGETPRPESRFARDTESPLSDAGSVQMNLLEEEFNHEATQDAEARTTKHAQRAKRQKVIVADKKTHYSSQQVKAIQADRSAIMQRSSFLPRDAVLLTLMTRQQNGNFVSSIFGEERSHGWAPELRDLLSLSNVKKSGELKRKRDSGISDMEEAADVPALEIGEDEAIVTVDEGIGLDTGLNLQSEIDFPGDDGIQDTAPMSDDGMSASIEDMDDTIRPVDTEPVSIGTKHAVHILRDCLGDSSAAEQKKAVMFQDLLPEQRSTKADATKMFFEVLVLATKDAVKVEQGSKSIGSTIKIRGKEALWGSWAEENAGGAMSQLSQLL
jgi:cohesin complex subunit SCC1